MLTGNQAARRLYEKHGFTPEGVWRQSVAGEGRLQDELRMARLRPAMPADSDELEQRALEEGEPPLDGTLEAPDDAEATPRAPRAPSTRRDRPSARAQRAGPAWRPRERRPPRSTPESAPAPPLRSAGRRPTPWRPRNDVPPVYAGIGSSASSP